MELEAKSKLYRAKLEVFTYSNERSIVQYGLNLNLQIVLRIHDMLQLWVYINRNVYLRPEKVNGALFPESCKDWVLFVIILVGLTIILAKLCTVRSTF